MHLFSRTHLAGSSGIVGASLPMGAGLALAAARLRPGTIAVAFVGEGALNQGMALETLNLASVWRLPLLVVCIDNDWSIVTRSAAVSAGVPVERAQAFGWRTASVDGTDAEAVHSEAGRMIDVLRVSRTPGPAFLLASCPRLDGHFLGDPLIRASKRPHEDGRQLIGEVVASVTHDGGGWLDRAKGMLRLAGVMARARTGADRESARDPLRRAREAMAGDAEARDRIEAEVGREIAQALEAALDDHSTGTDA
jgi:pyruvate dehydrogenase E1 component alpha subunit